MTTGEKFEELKKKDIAAKSDRERMVIDKELEQLANNDLEGFEAALIASAKQTLISCISCFFVNNPAFATRMWNPFNP